MGSIFYTSMAGGPAGALNARKSIYSKLNRSEGATNAEAAYNWLYKKIAYASANAKSKTHSASLTTPTKGGLGRLNKKGGSSGGLYQGSKIEGENSSKFFPKPHINSVRISSEGDFGSIRKCEVAFSVYNLASLNSMQAFFDIGGDLGVSYGWKDAGGAGGPTGRFQGKIYNFTYSLNANGGFDCVSYGMEAGISILGGSADAPTATDGKEITDALGNTIKANNIRNTVKVWEQEAKDLTNDATANGVGCVKYPNDWATAKDVKEGDEPAELKDEPSSQYYVSLEAIVKLVNKLAQDSAPSVFSKIAIVCNGSTTLGNMPGNTESLVSGNPREVLFPGFANYGEGFDLDIASYSGAFKGGDLSKSMISTVWLGERLAKLGTEKSKNTKSADSSISSFLQSIFDLIYKNSGERFKLGLVSKPNSKSGTEILVVDTSYVDNTVSPFEFTAVTQNSICRSMSLTAKVPNEMQTAAFVSAQSSFTSQNPGPLPGTSAGDKGPNSQPAPETLQSAKDNIAKAGLTPENVKSLQAAVKQERIGGPSSNKEATPVPIDFSATVDGVEGIIFGNIVTCNQLPAAYKAAGVAFTVTKVSHEINGGDWTTTVNTVCRLLNV